MTTLGWCSAAPGARPKHNLCPHTVPSAFGVPIVCGCECHNEESNTQKGARV